MMTAAIHERFAQYMLQQRVVRLDISCDSIDFLPTPKHTLCQMLTYWYIGSLGFYNNESHGSRVEGAL